MTRSGLGGFFKVVSRLDKMGFLSLGAPMWRREFVGVLIGAFALRPLRSVAHVFLLAGIVLGLVAISAALSQSNVSAQQKVPTIGYLSSVSAEFYPQLVEAFHNGLKERGFIPGQNVKIETRFAGGHYDQLPKLAAELIAKQIDIFVATGGTSTVVAAKPIVPKAMPLVFAMGGDPVKLGVVTTRRQRNGRVLRNKWSGSETGPVAL
jgi:ABC-type uncharacterized transport system substrate-binding protein